MRSLTGIHFIYFPYFPVFGPEWLYFPVVNRQPGSDFDFNAVMVGYDWLVFTVKYDPA